MCVHTKKFSFLCAQFERVHIWVSIVVVVLTFVETIRDLLHRMGCMIAQILSRHSNSVAMVFITHRSGADKTTLGDFEEIYYLSIVVIFSYSNVLFNIIKAK